MKSKQDDRSIFVEQFSFGGDGPVVAVKDTIDVAGFRTRAGSRALENAAPAMINADVVGALFAHGCRIVGKTNLHEFAYGVTGINDWTGTPRNTRFPDRVPGGSSSGSAAAVAAGIVDFALGTDTGGSIRVPAACCGVTGLKPTFGRISRAGVMPAVSSLDCVGPFARTVEGVEYAMGVIDDSFVSLPDAEAPVLGVVAVDAEPEIAGAVDRALRASGVACTPVALPGMQAAFDAGLTIIAAETFAAVGRYVDAPELGVDVRERLHGAQRVTKEQLAAAELVRASFTTEVDAALEGVDALVLPTMPVPTLTLVEGRDGRAAIRVTAFVRPFNLSGHPAISIPLPPRAGYSVGLQLVGRRGADAELCAVARAVEAAM